MPEENIDETPEPIEPVQHTYLTPAAPSTIILDPAVQATVDEFKKERLELDSLEDDTVQPEKIQAEVRLSELQDQLGGKEGIEALAKVLSDPDANLAQIFPQNVVEDLVWSALDNPVTQANVLADPTVRAVISREILNGHSIEDVQQMLSQYERGDGVSDEQLQAEYAAAEIRVQDFQQKFFAGDIDETIRTSGVDTSDVEAVTDRLLLARTKFLDANHQEFLSVQSLHERGLSSQATIPEARLHNKWMGTLLKELAKIKTRSATKTIASKAVVARDSQPDAHQPKDGDSDDGDERYDLDDPNWVVHFTKNFKNERIKRGL